MGNTKWMLGFIAGVAAGAIAGILLAPDSGAATRKKIADKAGDLSNELKDNISGWLDSLHKGMENEIRQAEQDTPPAISSGAL